MDPDDLDLISILRPFVPETIEEHVYRFPDDTPVRLSIEAKNGCAVTVTVRELRALVEAYRRMEERGQCETIYWPDVEAYRRMEESVK